MNSRTVILLALTAFTWFVLLGVLRSVIGVDDTGDRDIFAGLRWIFAGILICVLWAWLAALVMTAGGRGLVPSWINVVAALLLLASCGAALSTLYLLQGPGPWLRAPLAIPLGVPVVIAAYVFLLYRPGVTALPFHLAIWCIMLVFAVSPWRAVNRGMEASQQLRDQRGREFAAVEARQLAQRRAENLAKVSTMSPNQAFADWFTLLDPANGVRSEAFEALKKVPRRQGDVADGLAHGIHGYMELVPELDLQPTPELCTAAQSYLVSLAAEYNLGARDPGPWGAQEDIDRSLPAARWFRARGCNLDPGIHALETTIRGYLDSSDRRKVLDELAALKQAH